LAPPRARAVSSGDDQSRAFAARYLDVAKAAAGRTGAIALLWLATVAISWWSIEHELSVQSKRAADASIEYNTAAQRFEEAQGDVRKSSPPDGAEEKAKKAEEALSRAGKELNESRLGTVEFKLPTFPGFRVSTRVAPALLSAIILLLAVYLTFMRERAFRYLALALRLLRIDLKDPMERIGEVLGPRSWWVAPLPKEHGIYLAPEDFAVALGWARPTSAPILWIALFWLALIAIQLRVTYMAVSFLSEFISSAFLRNVANVPLVATLQGLYVMLFGITMSLGFWWLRAGAVPDYEKDPDAEQMISRRRFIAHARDGLVLALVSNSKVTYWFRTFALPFLRHQPRFRAPKASFTKTTEADGLRVNSRSNVVHLAKDGHITGLRDRRAGLWVNVPATLENAVGARSARSSLSPISEYVAKSLLRVGRSDAALSLLLLGIREDLAFKKKAGITRFLNHRRAKPRRRQKASGIREVKQKQAQRAVIDSQAVPVVSVRLYDMLFNEAVRLGRADVISELLLLIESNKLSPIFESRTIAWEEAKRRMPGK